MRCLKRDEVDEVMKEIHAGVCGPHMNGIILSKRIVRQGVLLDEYGKGLYPNSETVSSVPDTWES